MTHILEDDRMTYALAHFLADWLNEDRHRRLAVGSRDRDIFAEEILLAYDAFKGGAK